jgi:hypothetical protein
MVHLYNRLGDCLSFSSAAWEEVLYNARIHGWKASGTMPPPAPFTLDPAPSETLTWDGNYTRPRGQTVLPDDAIALSAAVERALTLDTDWSLNHRSALRSFAPFCRQRGFLVSPNGAPAIHDKNRLKLAS